jgi:hypothetical protein
MANGDNGTLRKASVAVLTAIITLWLGWASLSIATLNTADAVNKSQYCFIKESLDRIEHKIDSHMRGEK